MSRIFAPIIPGEDMVSGAQVIDGSLKLNGNGYDSGVGDYVNLNRTPASQGNLDTWTWSGWYKRSRLGNTHALWGAKSSSASGTYLAFNADKLRFRDAQGGTTYLETSAVYRDTNSWYHVVFVADTVQKVDTERLKLYVNGKRVTNFSTTNYPGEGIPLTINAARGHMIGALWDTNYTLNTFGSFNGHLSHNYLLDGQAIGPGYFGFTDPLTGTWRPRRLRDGDTTVNDGTTWSSYGSITAGTADGTTSQAFDGDNVRDVNADGITAANGNLLTWTFTTPIKYKQTFEVAAYGNGFGTSYLGEGTADPSTSGKGIVVSNITTGNGVPFYVIAEGGGAVQSISIRNSSERIGIVAIRVDGVIMTDATTTNIDFGTNGFYLPMDGNSLIGEDKSGKGNNWTPVNFGGSNTLEKATGAFPILNTVSGGRVATAGVRSVTEGFPNVGTLNDGTVWSSGTISGTQYSASYTWKQAFDGDLINTGAAGGVGGTNEYNVTLPKSIPFSSGVTVYANSNTADLWLNGTGLTMSGATLHSGSIYKKTFTSGDIGSSSLTQLGVDDALTLTGIEVDGELIVDALGLRLALPLVGIATDVSNLINSGSTANPITVTGAVGVSTNSNFYGGSFSFGSGDTSNPDYLDLGDTGLAFNNNSWTMEVWVYARTYSNGEIWFSGSGWNSNQGVLLTMTGTGVAFYQGSGGSLPSVSSSAVPLNSWHHIALSADGTNVTLYVDGVSQGSIAQNNNVGGFGDDFLIGAYRDTNYQPGPRGGFQGQLQDFRVYIGTAKYTSNFIPASINPDILPDTPSGVSGSSKLTKITDGAVSFDGSGDYLSVTENNSDFTLGSSGDFTIELYINASATNNCAILTNISDWNNSADYISRYGLTIDSNRVLWLDSNGSTVNGVNDGGVEIGRWNHYAIVRSGSTVTMYKNGISQGTVSGPDDYTGGGNLTIGKVTNLGDFNGYVSNVRFIKGTALYTSDFTPPTSPLTNVTNTKLLCCQSNTSATASVVTSGTITANGNAAATNFNPFATDINTVRGQETGYCTWNPLRQRGSNTVSNGNLDVTLAAGSGSSSTATFAQSIGKLYWEVTHNGFSSANALGVGIIGASVSQSAMSLFGSGAVGYYLGNGRIYIDGADSAYGAACTTGDIIGIALDLDSGTKTITFYKNGSSQGSINLPSSDSVWSPALSNGTGSGTQSAIANFGQKPFKFPPPDGFQPLNASTVRPSTVIARPDQYVGIATYNGSGATQSMYVGIKPDLVWIKSRAGATAYEHLWFDTVRGATKYIKSNSGALEQTNASTLSSFNSDGFTLGGDNEVNRSAHTYVAWAWKAGGSSNTFNIDGRGYSSAADAGLDGGTVTVTGASVNTKTGFSIIKYSGDGTNTTVSHGLGKQPKWCFIKNLTDSSTNWITFHDGYTTQSSGDIFTDSLFNIGDKSAGVLNLNDVTGVNYSYGMDSLTNASGKNYIAYLWADVPGLQKFGQYIGNLSTDGPFVELGFRPAILLCRSTTAGNNWFIKDNTRTPFNPVDRRLYPNANNNEMQQVTFHNVDFLSNGFKLRGNGSEDNASGDTILYAAWAEAPAFNLYGAQSNAR